VGIAEVTDCLISAIFMTIILIWSNGQLQPAALGVACPALSDPTDKKMTKNFHTRLGTEQELEDHCATGLRRATVYTCTAFDS
jgi:hypothetical protein